MDSIPKFMASVITIIIGVVLCISLIISAVVVNSARTYHSSVIEQIEASDFEEATIEKCKQKAADDKYVLTVEKTSTPESSATPMYKVTLNYGLYAPIFGKVHNGKLVGYALPGSRISEGSGEDTTQPIPGLYESGALSLYCEGKYDEFAEKLITPWDELVADGNVSLEGTKITSFDSSLAGDLVIDDDITVIGGSSFIDNVNITGVVIPPNVTSIEGSAFYGCSVMDSFVIKEDSKLTDIGDFAFWGCRSIESIVLPEGLKTIGDSAFGRCSGLSKVIIPSTVTFIDEEPFSGCSGITKLVVAEGNTKYHSDGNCLIETATKTLIQGCQTSVIPADGSVTSLAIHAFYEQATLNPWSEPLDGERWGTNRLIIPNGVTDLGKSSFAWCATLENVVIPEGVSSIPDGTFCACTSLREITIPVSVTSIGYEGLYRCGILEKIHYGGTREEWDAISFGGLWNSYTGNYTIYFSDGTSITKE